MESAVPGAAAAVPPTIVVADSGDASAAGRNQQQQVSGDLPAYALKHIPASRGGGGLFFLRSEKRDWSNVGKGGGFYERQGMTDKKEWDSDEEKYDEFGRKKRKKATPPPKSGTRNKATDAGAGADAATAPSASAAAAAPQMRSVAG